MSNQPNPLQVRIEPWTDADIVLLHRTNTPKMTEHLGGSETEEQIVARHKRYLAINQAGTGCMFRVISVHNLEPVGTVGYWEHEWNGENVYEIGWAVFPEFQGKGVAVDAAASAISMARTQKKHRFIYAFPSVENPASNTICRKLVFSFTKELEFEYPKGHFMRCNEWRLEL